MSEAAELLASSLAGLGWCCRCLQCLASTHSASSAARLSKLAQWPTGCLPPLSLWTARCVSVAKPG